MGQLLPKSTGRRLSASLSSENGTTLFFLSLSFPLPSSQLAGPTTPWWFLSLTTISQFATYTMFHRTKTTFVLLAFVYSAVLCAPVAEFNEQVGFSANGPAGGSATAGSNAHIQPKPILNALQQAARPGVDESVTTAEEDPQSASASSSYMPATPSTVAQEPTTSVAEQAQVTPTAVTSTSSASSSSLASSSTSSHAETTSSAPVSTTSSVPNPSLTALGGPRQTQMVMGYYPDWVGDSYPPEKIDFDQYDWVDFAFAEPGSDQGLYWDDDKRSPELLKRLTTAAHEKGSKVKLSVGGWAGSR